MPIDNESRNSTDFVKMYSDYVKCGMENDKRLNIIHSEISKFAHSQFHGRNWVIKLGVPKTILLLLI